MNISNNVVDACSICVLSQNKAAYSDVEKYNDKWLMLPEKIFADKNLREAVRWRERRWRWEKENGTLA